MAAASAPLAHCRAFVFDAYGTLLDFRSAAEAARAELGERWLALSELWRAKQLQYTWLRSLTGQHADFWQVTGDALDFALARLGVPDPALRGRLMELYERLPAYPEARAALAALRARGVKLAVLSNGAPRMLAAAIRGAGVGDLLDHVLSVEEVGVYKPHPSVYGLAAERLGLAPAELAFVSANGWDAWGAKAAGLTVAWCNRASDPPERLPGAPDVVVPTLAGLPALAGG